jgi:hypothetical protein
MTERAPSPRTLLAQVREVLRLGDDWPALRELTLEELGRRSRAQLLDCARRLGLTGLGRLTKASIAERFQQALDTLLTSVAPAPERPETPPARDAARGHPARKFDLGQPAEPAPTEHIPWGYGQDRVTAIVVDPDRLYVYWEATDPAIERARGALGPGGPGAWLSLRVYDVTGRLFDGTNAHGYFDQRVERTDRQWFLHIGRPGSTACVELGLMSHEGYFVRIARSGRADFPPRGPVPPGDVEWLTVSPVTGTPSAGGHSAHDERDGGSGGGPYESDAATDGAGSPVRLELPTTADWENGPLPFPVPPPGVIEERDEGGLTVRVEHGETRIVRGPWQVVIRGLGAWAERRVLATWEVRRSWTTTAGGPIPVGSTRLSSGGASERVGASELRFAGASERHRVGASEERYRGASEARYLGASEARFLGASEARYLGASEVRFGGASERAARR